MLYAQDEEAGRRRVVHARALFRRLNSVRRTNLGRSPTRDSAIYYCLPQIFLLSVLFGLFHGLAFLPVALIVLGGSFSSMLQLNRQTYNVKSKHQNSGSLS